jgi:hypothetical protein
MSIKSFSIAILLVLLNIYTQAQVGIGTNSPNASAQLDVTSNTKGFLPPRMTSTQRDAITSPANGLVIFNTSENRLEVRSASTWLALITLTGTETLTNKTLTTPVLSASSDGSVPPAGTVRYNTASGGILQYSNATSWNTLSPSVQKSVVTGYLNASTYANGFFGSPDMTEETDVNNNFASNTFTAPRTGYYTFSIIMSSNGLSTANTGGQWEVGITPTSGSTMISKFTMPATRDYYIASVTGTYTVRLTAGTSVNFYILNTLGHAHTLAGANYNRFSIVEN